ncbi:unnamed protein product, partial [Prorocentrum cordatum]
VLKVVSTSVIGILLCPASALVLEAKQKQLAVLRKQVQQLSRSMSPEADAPELQPQTDSASGPELQKKQKELDTCETVLAALEMEITASKPLGTQVHGIGNNQQIAKRKLSIDTEEKRRVEKQKLVQELRQQVDDKEK